MHRWGKIVLFVGITVATAGCPKDRTDFNQGRKAQDLHDYDAALEYYQKALKTDPENAEYQTKFNQARLDAGVVIRDQGAGARYEHSIDCAGERQRLAAAAVPISDQRSQRASEAVNFASSSSHRPPREVTTIFFVRQETGSLPSGWHCHPWQLDLRNDLPARHPIENQSVQQASLPRRASAHVMHSS